MADRMLDALGGEAGCQRLSSKFYARVAKDPELRPFFPGKSLRCATEEFAAFLIQFLGGDPAQTEHRWWVSLRESHARFHIGATERSAWLRNMVKTLEDLPLPADTREALRGFFVRSSAYVIGKESTQPENDELALRWAEQLALDHTVAAIAAGLDEEATSLARRFVSRPELHVALMARMVQSGRGDLIRFVIDSVESDSSLATRRFAGRTLLHFVCGAGCVEAAASLLRIGADPNAADRGGHTALYTVANECASETGPAIVRVLVDAGADVNACGGVTRATALHMAARRGHAAIAETLLDCGARMDARDSKGATPLQRAVNCRRHTVAALLRARGAG